MTKSYEKIMIATDGSENVKRAVSSGVELSRLSGAKLYAVNVMPPMSSSMPIGSRMPGWNEEAHEILKKDSQEAVEYVKECARAAGIEAEEVFLEGNPADTIIDFAEKNGIDMIVMGTLGNTGVERFLIGSVAENVVRHSKIEVLIVS